MTHTVLCINLRCDKSSYDKSPVYRVLLDDQVVVERRFWPETPDYYIQEQITLTDDDNEHSLKIKNIFPDRGSIYTHDFIFFDGNTREKMHNIKCKTVGNDTYTFVLPKR